MCRGCSADPTLAMQCRQSLGEEVRGVHLFAALRPELLTELLVGVREIEAGAEQWLCLHGTPAESFFLVRAGEVALLRSSEEGEEIIVAIVGHGELFAEELALQDDPRHPLSARTLGPCRLLSFDRLLFRGIVERQPELLLPLLDTLNRRNALLLDELERVTIQSASERLLAFLESQGATRGGAGPVRIPKRVLASRLAIRPETLSRILGQLKACHRLREVDGCLLSIDPTANEDRCDGCPARMWGCPGPQRTRHATAPVGTAGQPEKLPASDSP